MLKRKGLTGLIFRMMEWITWSAYLNFLWIVFSLVGIVFFGLAPATFALFTVMRKLMVEKKLDVKILSTFYHSYKKNFFSTNLRIWPLYVIGFILILDFRYLQITQGMAYNILFFVFVNALIIFLILSLYIFPVQIKYKQNTFKSYQLSLIIGISYPFTTLGLIISIFLLGLLLERIPGLILFFSSSLLCILITYFTHIAITKFDATLSKGK